MSHTTPAASFIVKNASAGDLEDRYASELEPANSHIRPVTHDDDSSAGDRNLKETPSSHSVLSGPSRSGSQLDKLLDVGDGPPRTPSPYIDFVPNSQASADTGEYAAVHKRLAFKESRKGLVSSLGRYPPYENVNLEAGRHQSNPDNSPVYENTFGGKMRAPLKMQPLGQKSEAPVPLPKPLCQNREHRSSKHSKNRDAIDASLDHASTDADEPESKREVQDQSRASFNKEYLEEVQLKSRHPD